MKLTEIKFINHYLFKNLCINFLDDSGKPLDLVVIAGINGSGKSTLLREIYEMFYRDMNLKGYKGNTIQNKDDNTITYRININTETLVNGKEITFSYNEAEKQVFEVSGVFEEINMNNPKLLPFSFESRIVPHSQEELLKQKIIYSPIEFVKKTDYKPQNHTFGYEYKFLNLIDDTLVNNVAVYYMTLLDQYVYSNPKLSVEESEKQFADDINRIFSVFNTSVKFIGRKGNSRLPVFMNKAGEVFDINGLSSGEKQLFIRFMSFIMVDPNNAIIMVDEPESSLHPAWQQNIVSMFKNMGKNNQIIIATQSPHVIASASKESLRFLELTDDANEPVRVAKWIDKDMDDGMPAERIMKELMGLTTTRNNEITKKINQLWDKVKNNDVNDKSVYRELEELTVELGSTDEDIILMRAQLNLRKNGKGYVINR